MATTLTIEQKFKAFETLYHCLKPMTKAERDYAIRHVTDLLNFERAPLRLEVLRLPEKTK